MMPCGWEGNRRSGFALAMRHRLQWFIHLRSHGLDREMSTPTTLSWWSMAHLPTLLLVRMMLLSTQQQSPFYYCHYAGQPGQGDEHPDYALLVEYGPFTLLPCVYFRRARAFGTSQNFSCWLWRLWRICTSFAVSLSCVCFRSWSCCRKAAAVAVSRQLTIDRTERWHSHDWRQRAPAATRSVFVVNSVILRRKICPEFK